MIHSKQASLRNLEIQIRQLATELRNRSLEKLATDTETPKRKKQGAMSSNRIEKHERNTQ